MAHPVFDCQTAGCVILTTNVTAITELAVFGCLYQCNRLSGKTRLWSDLQCVELDVKPYTFTHCCRSIVMPLERRWMRSDCGWSVCECVIVNMMSCTVCVSFAALLHLGFIPSYLRVEWSHLEPPSTEANHRSRPNAQHPGLLSHPNCQLIKVGMNRHLQASWASQCMGCLCVKTEPRLTYSNYYSTTHRPGHYFDSGMQPHSITAFVTELYCLVTEAHVCEQVVQGPYRSEAVGSWTCN